MLGKIKSYEAQAHRDIVYAPQGISIGETIHGLMLLHQVLDADEMEGHVEFL
jgi:hypothetical protein